MAELAEIAPKILPFMDVTWDLLDRERACRQAHPVRGRAGRAARHRPRHLSVRHLVEHGRGAGGDRLRHGPARGRLRARHRQGLYDARRLRAVPDRARRTRSARRSASAATSSARSRAASAAAAGSTPCWCARSCKVVRHRRHRADQARRARRLRRDQGLRRLHARRRADRPPARRPERAGARRADLRDVRRLDAVDARRAQLGAICRRRPSSTCATSRS